MGTFSLLLMRCIVGRPTWAGEQQSPKGTLLCFKVDPRGMCCLIVRNIQYQAKKCTVVNMERAEKRHKLKEGKTSAPQLYLSWRESVPMMDMSSVLLAVADVERDLR